MTFSRRLLARMNRGRVTALPGTSGGGPPADTDPPGVTSIVAIATGITITVDEDADITSTPASGDFSAAGTLATFGPPEWLTATTLWLPCADNSRITDFETVTLSYTAGLNPIRDVAENDLDNFSASAVTNSSVFLNGAVLIMNPHRAASYTLSGSDVATIVDEVTGTSHAVSGTIAYQATGFNGRPCFDFNGTTGYIAGTDSAIKNLLLNQSAHHIFVAAAFDSDDALLTLFSIGNLGTSDNNRRKIGLSSANGGRHVHDQVGNAGAGYNRTGVDGAPTTSPRVYEFFGSTTVSLKVDGTFDGASSNADLNTRVWSPATPCDSTTHWLIGAYPGAAGASLFHDGRIAYLVAFPSVLSDADATEVRNYIDFLA